MRSRGERGCFFFFVCRGGRPPLRPGPGAPRAGGAHFFSSGCWFHAILTAPLQSAFSGQTTSRMFLFLACLAFRLVLPASSALALLLRGLDGGMEKSSCPEMETATLRPLGSRRGCRL